MTMVSHKLAEVDVDVECTVDLEMCAVAATVGSEAASVVTEDPGEVSEAAIVVASAVEVTVIGKEKVAVEDAVVVEVSVFLRILKHLFTVYLIAPNEPRGAAPA